MNKEKEKEIKPCEFCGYYEDNIAYHYEDCPTQIPKIINGQEIYQGNK